MHSNYDYIHGDSIFRNRLHLHIHCNYICTRRNLLLPLLLLIAPLDAPFHLCTWHPPAVTGIVLLRLRLLVNWPHLPHPSPNCPSPSNFHKPNYPAPINDDLGTAPLLLCGTQRVWKKLKIFILASFCRFSQKRTKLLNFKMRWTRHFWSNFF